MNQHQVQQHIVKVLEGDINAFARIVECHKDMVFSMALKLLRNREEAEEVAQDVFVKVYQALPSFRGNSKFSTWVYKITYRTCLDHLKKLGRNVSMDIMVTHKEYNIRTVDTALDQMQREEQNAIIKQAIDALPETDAVVMTLFYYEELSLKEISEVVGLKTNAIKVRLFRSRKHLAQILETRLEPEIVRRYGGK